ALSLSLSLSLSSPGLFHSLSLNSRIRVPFGCLFANFLRNLEWSISVPCGYVWKGKRWK
ncbi:unnamed protein product, partial [Prunus brigantina]